MALSYSYAPTAGELIQGALEILRVSDIENTLNPTTAQNTNAIRALNLMLKSWENDQFQLFARTKATFSLVEGQIEYTTVAAGLSTDTRKLYDAFRTTDDIDVPLRLISEKEYNQLSNKSENGTPISLYFEHPKTATAGTTILPGKIYLYQPADTYNAGNTTVTVFAQKPFYSFTVTTDLIELPDNWLDAVKFNLALRLAHVYGIPMLEYDRLSRLAKDLKEEALGTDAEEVSLRIQPAFR